MLGASTEKSSKKERILYSRSPSPIQTPVPSFLPTKPDGSVDTESEQQLKDRFRKFWMESVADAFQDDLVQIHKVGVHLMKGPLCVLILSTCLGARYEQIPVGNARGLFSFRRGYFYVGLFDRNSRRKRN